MRLEAQSWRYTLLKNCSPIPPPFSSKNRAYKIIKKSTQYLSCRRPAISPQRRCEERMDYRHMCSYEIRKIISGESVIIGEGGAFVVNRSTEGLLLLMDLAPHAKQLIEVRISHSRWRKIVSIFEPRWTKPRQVESHGDLYLVGCRRKFGPRDYLAF